MCPQPTKQFFNTSGDIKGSDAEIAQAMSGIFAGFAAQAEAYTCPHILVGHFQVGGAMVSETQIITGIDIEISKDQMSLGNFDLVCLGHLHLTQKIEPNIFYSGSITRLNWGELEDKGFYIHEIHDDMGNPNKRYWSIKSRFIETPSRKLLKMSEDLTEDSAFEELETILHFADGPAPETKDAYMRVELKVYQDEAQKVNAEKIKNFFISGGAKEVDVRLIRVPRENIRSQNILKLTTLREKLIEQAALKKETVPESILLKADLLEAETNERIVANIASCSAIL